MATQPAKIRLAARDAAHTRLAGFVKQVGKQGLRASFTMQSRPITQSGTASHQSGTGQLGICLQEVVLPTICVHILKGQNAKVGISVSQGQLMECAPVAQWLERAAVTCSRTPRGRGFDTLRERIFCSHAFLLTHLFTPLPGLLYLPLLPASLSILSLGIPALFTHKSHHCQAEGMSPVSHESPTTAHPWLWRNEHAPQTGTNF